MIARKPQDGRRPGTGSVAAVLVATMVGSASLIAVPAHAVGDEDRLIVGYMTYDADTSDDWGSTTYDADVHWEYVFEGTWPQIRQALDSQVTGSAVQVSTYDPGGDCSPSVTTTTWTGDGSLGAQYPGQVQVSFGSATGSYQVWAYPPGSTWREHYDPACGESSTQTYDGMWPGFAVGYGQYDWPDYADGYDFPGLLAGTYSDYYGANETLTWEMCWKPDPLPADFDPHDPCPAGVDDEDVTASFDVDWDGDADSNRVWVDAQDSEGPIDDYAWDWGDGSQGDGVSTTHVYDEPGVYDVTLTVSNGQKSDSVVDTVVVNPVRLYAPAARFHPDEEWWPMDPGQFVRRSALWWNHDAACENDKVRGRGKLTARQVVGGAFSHQIASDITCRDKGKRYTTAQLTAPARKGDSKKASPGREGFYLDLANDDWHGVEPSDDTYSNAPALYYEYKPDRHVVYWFFYAFSGRKADKHEGDWERMVVRLGDGDLAAETAYYQHFCDPLDPATDYGHYSWGEMESLGYLTDQTHPDAYVAIAGHPTFPTDVGNEVFPCQANKGLGDRTADGGVVWETWEGELRDASEQPWYGAGVGWGDKIGPGTGWGPLGPGKPMNRSDGPAAPGGW